jgi:hypothetical protein
LSWIRPPPGKTGYPEEDELDYVAFLDGLDDHLLLVAGRFHGPERTLKSYHLVWPFIIGSPTLQRNFFRDAWRENDVLKSFLSSAAPDIEATAKGSLRAMFNRKTNRDSPDSCYMVDGAYEGSGERIPREVFSEKYLGLTDTDADAPRVATLTAMASSLLWGRTDPGSGFTGEAPSSQADRRRSEPDISPRPNTPRRRMGPGRPDGPGGSDEPPEESPSEGSPGTPVGMDSERINFMRRHIIMDLEEGRALMRESLAHLAPDDNAPDALDRAIVPWMNQFVALITNHNSSFFLVKHWEEGMDQPEFIHKSQKDIGIIFKPASITYRRPGSQAGRPKTYYAFDIWSNSPGRLFFKKISMGDPEVLPPSVFNTWRGHRIGPEIAATFRGRSITGPRTHQEISAQTVLDHIFTVFCRGNTHAYWYLMHWMAHVVQRPFTRTCSAVVLQSQEGVGKDLIFSDLLGAIIGPCHRYQTCRTEDLGGRFNVNLEGKILLIFDEITGISAAQTSALKGLITDPNLRIERKGVDAYEVDNLVNVVITTNDLTNKLMDVGPRARRWFFLDCDWTVTGRLDYFADLVYALGYNHQFASNDQEVVTRAFADVLWTMDLTDFNPRDIPDTQPLVDQKISSLNDAHLWWYECLLYRVLMGSTAARNSELDEAWEKGPISYNKQCVYGMYKTWASQAKKDPINVGNFWRHLKQLVTYGDSRPTEGGTRVYRVTFPKLATCQLQFTTITGVPLRENTVESSSVSKLTRAISLEMHNPLIAPPPDQADLVPLPAALTTEHVSELIGSSQLDAREAMDTLFEPHPIAPPFPDPPTTPPLDEMRPQAPPGPPTDFGPAPLDGQSHPGTPVSPSAAASSSARRAHTPPPKLWSDLYSDSGAEDGDEEDEDGNDTDVSMDP